MTDPQLSEMLHQISSCGLPDPVSTPVWPAHEDSIHDSSVQYAENPATADSHLGIELTADSIGSMGDLGREVPGGASRTSCEGTRDCSSPSGLLDVKQRQVGCGII